MNRFNPDREMDNGRREVASHDYPLIGPYDSSDPHALECQVLLMKFAGIDGVIVDWYGIRDFEDYAAIYRNTQQLISYLKKAGLTFAVCYEDQTVGKMVDGKALRQADAVAHGTEVMEWLQQNWFGDHSYLKVEGRPVSACLWPTVFRQRSVGDNYSVPAKSSAALCAAASLA